MIPKYPLEISDEEGIADALNYLLSGPAGLGQNFDGFSDYNPLIIRPTFARPFTLPVDTTLDASWYIRMPVTSITATPNPTDIITVAFTPPVAYTNPPFQFGDRLRLSGFADSGLPYDFNGALGTPTGTKATLATSQQFGPVATTTVTGTGTGAELFVLLDAGASAPYSSSNTDTTVDIFSVGTGYTVGDTIKVLGTALGGTSPANDLTLTVTTVDSGFYNDSYFVFSSTTTTVDLYTSANYYWPAITTLGEVTRNFVNTPVSTDCLAEVQVDSFTQRIFITAQVEFTYEILFETIPPLPAYYTGQNFDIAIQVNRYKISRNTQGNQIYSFQQTVSQKIVSDIFGSSTAGEASAIFTTVIDQLLNFGSYAYILEISFVTAPALSDGNSPGTSGYGTTPGWLYDYGFITTPTPPGALFFNLQDQSTPSGTTYTAVVPQVLTGIGSSPLLDVTVYPNINDPFYVVGVSGGIPDATVEITLNTTSASNNLDFVPGDTLKILGTDIGGASPLNDLYFTVSETDLRTTAVPGKFTMGLRNLTTQVIKE